MSARGEPRETQIPGGHVLTCFRASDCFKKLLVSTTRSVSSGPLALAIIAVFASGCATPVGVARLDEHAAHRKLNANVLIVGQTERLFDADPRAHSAQSALPRGTGSSACGVEFRAWQT